MKKGIVFFALTTFLLVSVSAQAAQEKVYRWRAQSSFSRGDFSADLLPSFAKEVAEQSNGRLQISTFYAGDLVPAMDTFKATSQGMIEMGQTCGVFWSDELPILGLMFGLPFGFKGTLEEVETLVEKTGLYGLWKDAYASKNCHLLGIHTYGPYPGIASNKPIRNLDDFKGLKIRAILEVADLLKELGAAPGYIPGGEIYMALKLGTFDAATYSVDAVRGFKWHEVMDYWILPYWSDWYFGDIIINQEAWESLPADLQKVLKEAMKSFGEKNKEVYSKEIELVKDQAEKLGYEVITLPDEDVSKMRQIAVEKVWSKFAEKGPECAKAIDAIKAYYGYQ